MYQESIPILLIIDKGGIISQHIHNHHLIGESAMLLFDEDWTLAVLTTIAFSILIYFGLLLERHFNDVPRWLKRLVPISLTASLSAIVSACICKAYLEHHVSATLLFWRIGVMTLTAVLTAIS